MDLVKYFSPALPEIILTLSTLIALMLVVFLSDKRKSFALDFASLAIIASVAAVFFVPEFKEVAFNGHFVTESFSCFIKPIIGLSAMAVILNIRANLGFFNIRFAEFAALMLLSLLGMFVLISSNDFLTMFVGLELQSLSLYVLLGLHHEENFVTEALIKYFVLGAIASGFILFGISFIYGYAGVTNFGVLEQTIIASQNISLGLLIGLVFLLCGLLFKVSAVPFHMWSPDVYQGTPYPLLLFFTTAPKLAALAIIMRLFTGPLYNLYTHWQPVLFVIASLCMVGGAIAAILQTNLKRFLAYASISSVGFTIIGISVASEDGLRASLFYTTLYIIGVVGLLSCIMILLRKGFKIQELSDLKGLATEKPFLAFSIAVLILSLSGLPPFPGFLGKLFLLQAVIGSEFYILAFVMVLATVIAAYIYLNFIKLMFFDMAKNGVITAVSARLGGSYSVVAVTLFILLALIILPTYLFNWSGLAASSLFYS